MATKNIKREALKALKEFQIAGELNTTADVSYFKEKQVRTSTRLIHTVFMKSSYIIIIDDTIDDDTNIILDILREDIPTIKGKFIANPLEDGFETFGLRHRFKDTYLFEVAPSKIRLDKEMARRYPEFSRSTIQKYIKAGYVKVNGVAAPSAKYEVTDFADISLTPPEKLDTSELELPIIYIDDNVIVLNKPAGVLTHSKGALNDEFTVADFFRRYTTNGLETTRPGIVHRLDRDTSGLIIGARNDETALMLKKQFSERTVKKFYTAVVEGVPEHTTALIDLPIGRNPSAPSTFRVDPKGKSAITSYEMVSTNGTKSLIELKPKTGRTHQLRVHMQYLRTPISGDRIYGTQKSAPRLCLHAHQLEITIPTSDRKVFTAPVPKVFRELVK